KEVSTGYDKSWLRDNFYECLAFAVIGDWDTVEKTYDSILNIFLKHEEKIDWAIQAKPQGRHEYIHARFHPETFEEFWEEWGNKQNDSIGAILYMIGQLEIHHKRSVVENDDHKRIVQKLVLYLQSIEYWHDLDNGVWEENEEVHASSVGACVAGLRAIDKLDFIDVPEDLIMKGEIALKELLPRESEGKFVDLAQLSLIYPYEVVDDEIRDKILQNLEYHLLRERGVIRYKNDYYYNKNADGFSEEAEWVFGLAWLVIIYKRMGDEEKAKELMDKLIDLDTEKGLPELYFSNSDEYNENTPLGWTESLFIVALFEMNNKFIVKPDDQG
ncbi:glycoside hydrolase family 15, partial [Candidatus Dojkabacteria bacterium]|nr:glycoside hydrolase family 15 [Candidatus Dojkabacteria bacterium]